MNNDGWGQVGAGQNDMRIAGEDLQHHNQRKTADENPAGVTRMVRAARQSGGPMKEALDSEMKRHTESRDMRLKHLEDHYKR
jgi:hypothetical protein